MMKRVGLLCQHHIWGWTADFREPYFTKQSTLVMLAHRCCGIPLHSSVPHGTRVNLAAQTKCSRCQKPSVSLSRKGLPAVSLAFRSQGASVTSDVWISSAMKLHSVTQICPKQPPTSNEKRESLKVPHVFIINYGNKTLLAIIFSFTNTEALNRHPAMYHSTTPQPTFFLCQCFI